MDVAEIDQGETIGVDGTQTLYVSGQFCIPVDSNEVIFSDSVGENANILNDVDYVTTDDSGMVFCINNAGISEEDDPNPIIYYSNEDESATKSEPDFENIDNTQLQFIDDNGTLFKTLNLDEGSLNVDSILENTADLNQINENYGLSGFQYVVQLNDLLYGEDTQDSFLCNEIQTPTIDDPSNEQLEFIDVSELSGTNHLIGQTISNHLENVKKPHEEQSQKTAELTRETKIKNQQDALNSLLNKKLTIGTTINGRRLVGRIIRIGKIGDSMQNNIKSDVTNPNQMLNTVINNGNQNELSKLGEFKSSDVKTVDNPELSSNSNSVGGNITEYISRILTSLMEMESVWKKLQKKHLLINITEKVRSDNKIKMNMLEVQGHLEMRKGFVNNWVFKMNKGTDKHKHGFWCPKKNHRKFEETMQLIASIELADGTIQSAKVNVNNLLERCSICSEEFKGLFNLKMHLKLVHLMRDGHFLCHLCDNSQKRQNVLKERQANRKRSFGCTKCRKQYNSERNLSKHMRTYHISDNWKLVCKICGEEYTKMSLWRKHMLTHTMVKPDQKEYYTYGDMSYHTRMNDSKSCYVCKVCNRTFSKYSNLQRHSEIHGKKNSIALYSCSMCGCTYNYISSLTRHIVQNHLTVP